MLLFATKSVDPLTLVKLQVNVFVPPFKVTEGREIVVDAPLAKEPFQVYGNVLPAMVYDKLAVVSVVVP